MGVSHLEYERQARWIERYENQIIDEYTEAGVAAENLQSLDAGQGSDPDQQCLDESVQGDSRSEEGHSSRNVRSNFLLAPRAQRDLCEHASFVEVYE